MVHRRPGGSGPAAEAVDDQVVGSDVDGDGDVVVGAPGRDLTMPIGMPGLIERIAPGARRKGGRSRCRGTATANGCRRPPRCPGPRRSLSDLGQQAGRRRRLAWPRPILISTVGQRRRHPQSSRSSRRSRATYSPCRPREHAAFTRPIAVPAAAAPVARASLGRQRTEAHVRRPAGRPGRAAALPRAGGPRWRARRRSGNQASWRAEHQVVRAMGADPSAQVGWSRSTHRLDVGVATLGEVVDEVHAPVRSPGGPRPQVHTSGVRDLPALSASISARPIADGHVRGKAVGPARLNAEMPVRRSSPTGATDR